MGKSTELRQAVRSTFFPLLQERGFVYEKSGSPLFMSFRKIGEHQTYLIDIHWDKYYRPRFVIEFGHCGNEGVEYCGTHISADEVLQGQLQHQGRLYANRGNKFWSRGDWFRQDLPLLKRLILFKAKYPADRIIDQLIQRFYDLEVFWQSGQCSKYLAVGYY